MERSGRRAAIGLLFLAGGCVGGINLEGAADASPPEHDLADGLEAEDGTREDAPDAGSAWRTYSVVG